MRFSSVKIEKLLTEPEKPESNQFYLVENLGVTKFYLCDSYGNLILLNEDISSISLNSIIGETPSGTMNGSNATFTLTHTPVTGTLALFLDGIRLSSPGDYTWSGATLTMINKPYAGDVFIADYRY